MEVDGALLDELKEEQQAIMQGRDEGGKKFSIKHALDGQVDSKVAKAIAVRNHFWFRNVLANLLHANLDPDQRQTISLQRMFVAMRFCTHLCTINFKCRRHSKGCATVHWLPEPESGFDDEVYACKVNGRGQHRKTVHIEGPRPTLQLSESLLPNIDKPAVLINDWDAAMKSWGRKVIDAANSKVIGAANEKKKNDDAVQPGTI